MPQVSDSNVRYLLEAGATPSDGGSVIAIGLNGYSTRDAQVRHFRAHGFEVLACLDLDGQPVGPGELAAHCPELHSVAKRVG
jgi:hypothetical protein